MVLEGRGVKYLLRKAESAGCDSDSAERDWRIQVWIEACGTDSMG